MKKILVIALLAMGLSVSAQDGKLSAGLNLGLPLGSAGDAYSFVVAPELNYLFGVADNLEVGPSVAFYYMFAKEMMPAQEIMGVKIPAVKPPNSMVLPVAGTAKYNLDQLFLGVDLGYAIGISEGAGSGFYYRPKVGYSFSDSMTAQLGYAGFSSDGATSSVLTLGLVFGL